jgi:hypothetical protein
MVPSRQAGAGYVHTIQSECWQLTKPGCKLTENLLLYLFLYVILIKIQTEKVMDWKFNKYVGFKDVRGIGVYLLKYNSYQ